MVVAVEEVAGEEVAVGEEEDSRNQPQLCLVSEEMGMGDSKAIPQPFSTATAAKVTNS